MKLNNNGSRRCWNKFINNFYGILIYNFFWHIIGIKFIILEEELLFRKIRENTLNLGYLQTIFKFLLITLTFLFKYLF